MLQHRASDLKSRQSIGLQLFFEAVSVAGATDLAGTVQSEEIVTLGELLVADLAGHLIISD
jgi:hypothetical protein